MRNTHCYNDFLYFLLVSWFLLGLDSPIAQELEHPTYKYQERTDAMGKVDRLEGLKPIDIAGENISLLAAFLNTPSLQQKDKLESMGGFYRLGFVLPEKARVTITVRDYDKFRSSYQYHYWMHPIRAEYERGFNEFIWDIDLARRLKLLPEDLGVVLNLSHSKVAPVLLYAGPFPSRIQLQGCRFVFIPNETMDLDYKLYSQDEKPKLFLESKSERWFKSIKRTIYWNGRDPQGKSASAGNYILSMTMKIAGEGQPEERLSRSFIFYYTPEIALKP